MHILLGILKIAGIILLIILGLLLLILAVVLFTPVRYRGRISTGGDIAATKDPDRLLVTMNATWIPKLAHVSFELKEKKIRLSVKAAGKTIVQKGEEAPSKGTEPKDESPADRKAAEPDAVRAEEETVKQVPEPPAVPEPSEKQEDSFASWFYQTSGEEADDEVRPSDPEPIQDNGTPENDVTGSGQSSGLGEKAARMAQQTAERIRKAGERFSGSLDGLAARVYQQAADFIFEQLERLDGKTDLLGRKADEIGKMRQGLEPFTDWVSRGYYGWFVNKALRAIRHFRVRKIRGHIRFGTGRPDLTGLMGGALWSLLPVDEMLQVPEDTDCDPVLPGGHVPLPADAQPYQVTERNFVAEADFYRLKLDVNTDFKGHIRLCHVAWLGLRTVCKRDSWMMFRKIKNRRR